MGGTCGGDSRTHIPLFKFYDTLHIGFLFSGFLFYYPVFIMFQGFVIVNFLSLLQDPPFFNIYRVIAMYYLNMITNL
jgi:hypothetical protein